MVDAGTRKPLGVGETGIEEVPPSRDTGSRSVVGDYACWTLEDVFGENVVDLSVGIVRVHWIGGYDGLDELCLVGELAIQ